MVHDLENKISEELYFISDNDNSLQIFSEKMVLNYQHTALDVLGYSSAFQIGLGWHYLLDMIWIIEKLKKCKRKMKILDAGGGMGLLQYILACYGHAIVSVDAFYRDPPDRLTKIFSILNSGDSKSQDHNYVKFASSSSFSTTNVIPNRVNIKFGEIEFHCSDLSSLKYIDDDEFDAIVSVSALEHNPSNDLHNIMDELTRVCKRNGLMLFTISTSLRGGYDFHKDSLSYLYDEHDLMKIYRMPDNTYSNFNKRELFVDEMFNSTILRKFLGYFYYLHGRNGMPYGIWDPKYLPLGISKINLK